MCGRKTLTRDLQSIIEELSIIEWYSSDCYAPSYNICPGQYSPIMIQENDSYVVKPMKWGLVPDWADKNYPSAKLINARSETILQKPSFQGLVPLKRCVVISDGYYEWQHNGRNKEKQPIYIYHSKGMLLPMAGLWSSLKSSTGKELLTYTVITTTPQKRISHIHNRMPVILSYRNLDVWLNINQNPVHKAIDLLIPSSEQLSFHPVSNMVNSHLIDCFDCIRSISGSNTLEMF